VLECRMALLSSMTGMSIRPLHMIREGLPGQENFTLCEVCLSSFHMSLPCSRRQEKMKVSAAEAAGAGVRSAARMHKKACGLAREGARLPEPAIAECLVHAAKTRAREVMLTGFTVHVGRLHANGGLLPGSFTGGVRDEKTVLLRVKKSRVAQTQAEAKVRQWGVVAVGEGEMVREGRSSLPMLQACPPAVRSECRHARAAWLPCPAAWHPRRQLCLLIHETRIKAGSREGAVLSFAPRAVVQKEGESPSSEEKPHARPPEVGGVARRRQGRRRHATAESSPPGRSSNHHLPQRSERRQGEPRDRPCLRLVPHTAGGTAAAAARGHAGRRYTE